MPLPARFEGLWLCRKWALERLYRGLVAANLFWLFNDHWFVEIWVDVSVVLILLQSSDFGNRRHCQFILPNLAWSWLQVLQDLSLLRFYSGLLHSAKVLLNVHLVLLFDPLFLFSAGTFALPIDSINHILNARRRYSAHLMLDIDIDRTLGLNLR